MRQLIKLGFLLGSFISTGAYALNPQQGFYLGVLGQVSHSPNLQFNPYVDPFFSSLPANAQNILTNITLTSVPTIILQPVGGGGAVSLGYKLNQFRAEAEFFLNYNSYRQFQFTTAEGGTCTLQSPSVVAPTCAMVFPVSSTLPQGTGLAFSGKELVMDGFFNVFFDFWFEDPTISIVPYIGGGVGAGLIKNTVNFQNNTLYTNGNTVFFVTGSNTTSSLAAQGILGVYYYMDDFTTINLDFRYISAFKSNNNTNFTSINSLFGFSSTGIPTINIGVNFVLDNAFPS